MAAGPVLVLALAGCGGDQDSLHAASSAQSSIVELFWVMVAGGCVGFGVVVSLLFLGWWRRDRPGLRDGSQSDRGATMLVVGLGIGFPVVVLSALFVRADIFVMHATAAPAPA